MLSCSLIIASKASLLNQNAPKEKSAEECNIALPVTLLFCWKIFLRNRCAFCCMNGIQADSRSKGFSSFSFQKRKVSQIIMKTTNEISSNMEWCIIGSVAPGAPLWRDIMMLRVRKYKLHLFQLFQFDIVNQASNRKVVRKTLEVEHEDLSD